MKISRITATDGLGGFWNDDNEAIKRGAEPDGFTYKGEPLTPGFKAIRQPSKAVPIILTLESGELAFGDCTWVQYGGERAGREKLASTESVIALIYRELEPWLIGLEIRSFRSFMKRMDEELMLPRSVQYGISQAILDAVAKTGRKTMAEVLATEYGTTIVNEPLTFFAQCGDEYYYTVDKMILRRIPVHPHALINSVSRLKNLLVYIDWTKKRIRELVPDESYNPILHYDLYGNLGLAYQYDIDEIVEYLRRLEETARPFKIQVEDPVYMSSKIEQMEMMSKIRRRVREEGLKLKLVADEWVPTLEDKVDFIEAGAADIYQIKPPDLGGVEKSVEAILYCKSQGVLPYLGGSCAETERSAQVSVHVALATRPHQVLIKPGMGVDEGISIMYNEMMRALTLIFGTGIA
jgi:methylaspartate ammonia-lyase